MRKEDEFNSQKSELTNDKLSTNYQNKNEFENPSTYTEPPEIVVKAQETKEKSVLQKTATITVALVGGSIIGVTPILSVLDSNHTEIIEFEASESFCFFSFETTEQDLTARIYNDYQSIDVEVTYEGEDVNEKDETIYYAYGFCETLRPNTNYDLTIEGETSYGSVTSRVKKHFKTSKISDGPDIPDDPSSSSSDPSSSSSSSSSSEPDSSVEIPWNETYKVSFDYSKIIEDKLVYHIDFSVEKEKENFTSYEFFIKGTGKDPITTQDEDYENTVTFNEWQDGFDIDFTALVNSDYLFSITTYGTRLGVKEELNFMQFSPYAMQTTKPDDIWYALDTQNANKYKYVDVEVYLDNKVNFYTDLKMYLQLDVDLEIPFARTGDSISGPYRADLNGYESYRGGNLRMEIEYNGEFHEFKNETINIYESSYYGDNLASIGDTTNVKDTGKLPLLIEFYDYDNLFGDWEVIIKDNVNEEKTTFNDLVNGENNLNIDVSSFITNTEFDVIVNCTYSGIIYEVLNETVTF